MQTNSDGQPMTGPGALKHRLKSALSALRKSTFVKNVLIVMTGSALAQIIGFALTPIISRLFAPADFGVFGSFGAVVGIISAGLTLEYAQALMLPKAREDALALLCASIAATIFITFLCGLACLVAPAYFLRLMQAPNAWVLVLFLFALLILGGNITLQAWCVRIKAFKHTSGSQVIRSLTSNGLQVGLGFCQAGSLGLMISSVAADLVASLNLLRAFLADLKSAGFKIDLARVKRLAFEYRDFPFYSASANLINALSMGLPVLLLSNYFGIAVAGAFAFAERILSAPMGLILRALRQVLFQKAAETSHQGGSLLALYVKTTTGLFGMVVGPALVMVFWAPEIFSFVFSSKWALAGNFASSLVIWLAFMFCNLPAVLFARILRLQRQLFFLEIITLSARTLVLVLGGLYLTEARTVFLFALVGAIINLNYILVVGFILVRKEGAGDWKALAGFWEKG